MGSWATKERDAQEKKKNQGFLWFASLFQKYVNKVHMRSSSSSIIVQRHNLKPLVTTVHMQRGATVEVREKKGQVSKKLP